QAYQRAQVHSHYRGCNAQATTGPARRHTQSSLDRRKDDGFGTFVGTRAPEVVRSPVHSCVLVGRLSTCRRVRRWAPLSPSHTRVAPRTPATSSLDAHHQSRVRRTRTPGRIACSLSIF